MKKISFILYLLFFCLVLFLSILNADQSSIEDKQIKSKKEKILDLHTKTYIKHVAALVEAKKFEEFEKEIFLLAEDLHKNSELIYKIYSSISRSSDIKNTLDEWCEKYPKSYIALTIRGDYYTYFAWEARGTGWAKDVPEEKWPIFAERLKLAEVDFKKAVKLSEILPFASIGLIIISRAIPIENQTIYMERYLKKQITLILMILMRININ